MKSIEFKIRPVSKEQATRLIVKYHYLKLLPKINKLFLGGFIGDECVAVMTLGYGVRPLHTINALFPSLTTKDYYEIGRLCLKEEMPKNTESVFISRCLEYIKQNCRAIKLVFSWSDGMLGKPGYVYQSSNFLYGSYIWTDTYFDSIGERIHPRATNRLYGGRPKEETLAQRNLKHYRGKQYRYLYFLCSHAEKKRLLKESTITWNTEYPKENDLCWKVKDSSGEWITTIDRPYFKGGIQTHNPDSIKICRWNKDNKPLDYFLDAGEVSREKRLLSKLERSGQFRHSALRIIT